MQGSSNNRINIAQIGVGYWGMNLLRNMLSLPDAQVVLACDTNTDALEQAQSAYPELATTTSAEDIWNDETVDAVVIATETSEHYSLAKEALQSGKHVFVEKPLTRSSKQAEELINLADERGMRLMVGHLLLYHPAFTYVQSLIQTGKLGNVRYIYSTRVNLGIVRQNENAFESLAPHDLSIALSFIECSPVAISANGQAFLQNDIEDVVFATVFFENGALAHIHASWLDPHKVRKTTIVGDRKMAVVDDMESAEKVRIFDKRADIEQSSSYADFARSVSVRSGDIMIPKITMAEPLFLECREFVECIREERSPRTDGRSGLNVVRLLNAARESIRNNGTPVSL